MQKQIHYKAATKTDGKLIYELALTIWNEHYVPIIGQSQVDYMLSTLYSEKSLVNQMESGQNFFIIYENDSAIGYYSISINEEVCFLHKLYINLTKHQRGIGTEVLKEIFSQAKNSNTIELTVNRKNFKTINFYFKNGFRINSVEDFDIGNGYFMNDFVMVKNMK